MKNLILLLILLFALDILFNPKRQRVRKRIKKYLWAIGQFFRRIGHKFPSVRRHGIKQVVIGKVAANVEEAWKNTDKKDYVYVIQNSFGDYKIGTTKAGLQSRISSFKTANSRQLWLVGLTLGTENLEQRIHKVLKHVRTETDNEWFHAGHETDELLRHVGINPIPLFKTR